MSDQDIARRARGLLATLIDDFDAVKVEVEGGVAYLEGIAATAALRQRIEQLIRRVPGVTGVVNCLAMEHVARLPYDTQVSILPGYAPQYVGSYRSWLDHSQG